MSRRLRVFVLIISVITSSCLKKVEDPSTALPTIGSSIVVTNKTSTSMTLTWGAATDDSTQESLQYKVVVSSLDNISTVEDAEANGTLAMDWTANILTTSLMSLSMSTTYYFAVLVKDEDANKAIDHGSAVTLCSGKIIFLATVSNGNIGGSVGADAICNANKPTGFSGSTFRALVANGSTRAACYSSGNDNCGVIGSTGRANWVFTANQVLCTSDFTKHIGTTGSDALLNSMNVGTISSTETTTFTGFNAFWGNSLSNNCTNFTSTGGANATGSSAASGSIISGVSISCNSAGSIYCVEQ